MTDERMFTVPEVARFFGITPQAVRQRIVEGRLQASKVRVKGIAREYRISGEAIQEHYDLSDADMRLLASETVRYRVGFMGWGLGLPFPDYQQEPPYLRPRGSRGQESAYSPPALQGGEFGNGTLAARGFPSGARQGHCLPRPVRLCEIRDGLRTLSRRDHKWCGGGEMTLAADGNVAAILSDFGGDPQRAEGLAEFLGFEPISNPEDRLAGALSGGLKQFLHGRGDGGSGVSELYRVGSCKADPAEAGLWIGVLSDWGYRSSDRDRSRRRITRALVEHVSDRRSLALLVPPSIDSRREAELVFPRTQIGTSNGAVTSVRAHLDLDNPTRFHRDLLRGLRIPLGASLLEVSRTWQQQFSVERVTTKFYQEYAAVRDRIAKALLAYNQDHPVVKSFTPDEARAWGHSADGPCTLSMVPPGQALAGAARRARLHHIPAGSVGPPFPNRRGRILSRHSVSDVFRRYGDGEQ